MDVLCTADVKAERIHKDERGEERGLSKKQKAGLSKQLSSWLEQRGGMQPLEIRASSATLDAQEHSHGARPGSRCGLLCTDRRLACPAAESAYKKLGRRRPASQKNIYQHIFCIDRQQHATSRTECPDPMRPYLVRQIARDTAAPALCCLARNHDTVRSYWF